MCSEEGVLILRLTGEVSEMNKLEAALNELPSVQAKMIVLD